MLVICCKVKKKHSKYGAFIILSCDKWRSHFTVHIYITYFTRFWAVIHYKKDNKFNRNTLKLNSLPYKVLGLHMFLPLNINSINSNISSRTLWEAMSTSIMTRTANLRDLGWRIYSTVLPRSHAAHFPLKRPYFCSPKLVYYSSWRLKLSRSLCLHYYFISNSNISLQKWHNKLTLTSVNLTCWHFNDKLIGKGRIGGIKGMFTGSAALFAPQTTSRLASLADFFSLFSSNAEPGPRLQIRVSSSYTCK